MAAAVKICGIRRREAALVAAEARADMIGLIFAPSRRQVEVGAAREIVEALRQSPAGQDIVVVGVFVDERPERVTEIVDAVGLDWVQLSGHEPATYAAALTVPAVKALRFDGDPSEAGWLAPTGACDQPPLLVDAHVRGSFGGAGVLADWPAAAKLARSRPILLAGGLDPSNVAAAIAVVQPWGVDVSSGVEAGGVKDLAKIRAFIHAAKHAPLAATPNTDRFTNRRNSHDTFGVNT